MSSFIKLRLIDTAACPLLSHAAAPVSWVRSVKLVWRLQ